MRLLAASASFLVLAACAPDERGTVRIAPEMAPCVGFSPMWCNLTTDVADLAAPRQLNYGIAGYEHRWGDQVELDYRIEVDDDPPADGSSRIWHAEEIRVIGTAAAGDRFRSHFAPDSEGWFVRAGTGAVLAAGTEIRCTPEQCTELVDRRDALELELAHDGAGGLDLVEIVSP